MDDSKMRLHPQLEMYLREVSELAAAFAEAKRAGHVTRRVQTMLDDYVEDPYLYWRQKSSLRNVLKRVARRFLAVRLTTTGVERLFSIAGWLKSRRRGRMTIIKLRQLVQVNNNLDVLRRMDLWVEE